MIKTENREEFSIFAIGPMGRDKDFAGRVSFDDHLNNIKRAVLKICQEIEATDLSRRFRVETAYDNDLGNDIIRFVLPRIDGADLGIADISGRSPSVMYELSLMHCLGIPVLILDYDPYPQRYETPIYLRNALAVLVDDFAQDELEKKLRPRIIATLNPSPVDLQATTNEITKFYNDVALVDVAASAGLATGQFYNFLQYVLEVGGVLSQSYDPELRELVIIRPNSIRDARGTNTRISRALPELKSMNYKIARHPRGSVIFDYIGNQIVDYPTPLNSLPLSPRYQRLASLVQSADAPALRKLEDRMIESYIQSLRHTARKEMNVDETKLRFMTEDEFIAQASRTP